MLRSELGSDNGIPLWVMDSKDWDGSGREGIQCKILQHICEGDDGRLEPMHAIVIFNVFAV